MGNLAPDEHKRAAAHAGVDATTLDDYLGNRLPSDFAPAIRERIAEGLCAVARIDLVAELRDLSAGAEYRQMRAENLGPEPMPSPEESAALRRITAQLGAERPITREAPAGHLAAELVKVIS